MTTVLNFISAVAAAALVAAVASPAAAETQSHQCYRDWAAAQHAVREYRLSPVDQVSQFARRLGAGQVVKAVLCRQGDHFEYRVILRDARGHLTRQVITARTPFTFRRQVTRKHAGKSAELSGAGRPGTAPTAVAIVSPSQAK